MAHAKKNDAGVEIYKDEAQYTHEEALYILDNMIKMVQQIQKITIGNKDLIYNNELAKLNQNKNIETLEQKTATGVDVAEGQNVKVP